ncbi:site-specific integrase [Luteimonas yindakuii]|nr:site-specific integrase [Luteimonas yindakuii]QCO66978.2 site-specific integrase [Luteimonas yindakuii]
MIVPAALQSLLGRVEITRSLRTGDRREAARRLALWETHIRTYLALVRQRKTKMTQDELDQLTRRYTQATFDEIENRLALEGWDEPGLDVHRWDLADEAERLAAALAHADYSIGIPWAHRMLPDAAPETLRKLGRRLIEAKLEALKAELRALSGEPLRMPPPALERDWEAPQAPLKPTPTLSEVVTSYAEERVARKAWSARTEAQFREIYAVVVSLIGDRPIGAIEKSDLRALGLSLTRFPSNAKKSFPGLTPVEALARASEDEAVPRLSAASVNMYQQAVRSLFKWATEHDLIAQSPATVLRDLKTGRAKDDRKPFTDEDLRAYFMALERSKVEPFMYWIPRILAYTGCRLGEAAQLQKRDVREEHGVWFFDINEDAPGKQLKTDSSARQVPVHRRLIELGLLEFVAGTEAPDGYLWPADMRSTPRTDRSPIDKLQKRLAHRMRRAGIDDPKKTAAHSFRHTVAARLAAAGAHETDIAWILGHEQVSITSKRYGDRPAVASLQPVINLLDLPV